jgi:predicted Kef-type K+ transport protein
MSPVVKYTLARVGLFAAVFAALLPVDLDIFIKLLIALVASAGFSFILLRGLRDQVANQMASAAERRKAEKDRLRAALAGDDEPKKES